MYKTTTAGIDVAVTGDTVLVDAGIYKEKNLFIKKSIVLTGINISVLDGKKNTKLFPSRPMKLG